MNVLDKLKSAIGNLFPKEEAGIQKKEIGDDQKGEIDKNVEKALEELNEKNLSIYWLKTNDLTVYQDYFSKLPDEEKAAFIVYAAKKVHHFFATSRSYSSMDKSYKVVSVLDPVLKSLVKISGSFNEDQYIAVLYVFCQHQKWGNVFNWPIGMLVSNIEKYIEKNALTPKLKTALEYLLKIIEDMPSGVQEKEKAKMKERLETIFFAQSSSSEKIRPVYFKTEDDFGVFANGLIEKLPESEKQIWFQLLSLTMKTSGSKPTQKFFNVTKDFYKELGIEKFKAVMNSFFEFIIAYKEKEIINRTVYDGREYEYTNFEFLNAVNLEMIKGLTWICANFYDKATLFNIAKLAERSYKKIPGKGPTAPSLGNACLYVLYESKGLEGISHLSRLRLKLKQNNAQKLIQSYLEAAAKKHGITVHEIEEIAIDDYGLENGIRTFDFEGYSLKVQVVKPGKIEMNWYKEDGTEQKSVPKMIVDKYAKKLKQAKDTIKQIEINSTGQKDRFDQMFKSTRTLTWQQFENYYFNHGLVSTVARKLIWLFELKDRTHALIYINDQWVDFKGEAIEFKADEVQSVKLWHPVHSTVEEIRQWRSFILNKQIEQPLKQAFREVYILTDAEINTRVYSNRMAAHILKQHQFNSLAKGRGWKYALLGAFDNGMYNQGAIIPLPEHNLQAEFWVNEVNSENDVNGTGIWSYIATDQVRFARPDNAEPVDLIDVLPLVFSEIMRDVDLFVGVASVGNDPEWQDRGGEIGHRDYWQSYSFGDLSEIAKTRKEILEGLIPRLKIKDIATIKDKFLVVKGKLRTYKIHIGSTNILMEPNDQYLCIVKDNRQKSEGKLFLPFEGDTGLSIIISKALLLAEDDKITDSTITSQINRK